MLQLMSVVDDDIPAAQVVDAPPAAEKPFVYPLVKRNRWMWNSVDHPPNREEPTVQVPGLDEKQVQIALIRARMMYLNRQITSPLTYDGPEGREASPEPIYDGNGGRVNTREKRVRDAIKTEQQALVEKALGLSELGEGLQAAKKKHDVRLEIPIDKYPDYNFKGVLIGPRGMNMKRLEQETQCRIAVRGLGMRKRKDGLVMPGDELPLHVLIETWDEEKVQPAIEIIKKLLVPVAPEERSKQLRELAIINGTFRGDQLCQNCGETGHLIYACPKRETTWKPADVTCELCGDKTHVTHDCPHANSGAARANGPALDNEYEDFMKELTGEDVGTAGRMTLPAAAAPPAPVPSAAPGGWPPQQPAPPAHAATPIGRPGLGFSKPPAQQPPPMMHIRPKFMQQPAWAGAPAPSAAPQGWSPQQPAPPPQSAAPNGWPPQQPAAAPSAAPNGWPAPAGGQQPPHQAPLPWSAPPRAPPRAPGAPQNFRPPMPYFPPPFPMHPAMPGQHGMSHGKPAYPPYNPPYK